MLARPVTRLALGPLVLLAAACTADDPVDRPGEPDADLTSDLLPSPSLTGVIETTPLETVALRGSTAGARIATVGPRGTQLTAVLPGGAFCQDAPLDPGGANLLEVFAVGGDGRVSEPVTLTVTQDPEADVPAMGTCAGGGAVCEEVEACGTDELDEDCNGWADACDLACSECVDDAYEPNDVAVNVPTIEPGSYDLALCPCRDDWFAFHVGEGEPISATIAFVHDEIDIDLRLFYVEPGGGGTGVQVADSVSSDDVETIDHVAAMAGTYFLRVYPFDQESRPRGTYQLTVGE
jgi:hypothetical protein